MSKMVLTKLDDKPVSLPRENPQISICGPTLLRRGNMAVGHEVDMVHLEIGGQRVTMHYTTALQLSGMLRMHGKHAKRLAGDQSTHFSVFATVTDAEEGYKKGWS